MLLLDALAPLEADEGLDGDLAAQLLFGLHRPGGGGGRLCCGLRGRFGVIIVGDGLHLLDVCQLVLCILQAQLGLLNVQFLPVQGELGQGGVIGQKDRALPFLFLPSVYRIFSSLQQEKQKYLLKKPGNYYTISTKPNSAHLLFLGGIPHV